MTNPGLIIPQPENRLVNLFKGHKKDLLSVYFTAGFPQLDQTLEIALSAQKAGVDFIEIGFPFSDPTADGPVIQQSSQQALSNGMSVKLLFSQLRQMREELTIPVVLMGYLNPVLQFGVENFLQSASECGVDALILPDLPVAEYSELYAQLFAQYHLSNIFLVSPQTSDERIKQIDDLSGAFIYVLSSSSITGRQLQVGNVSEQWFRRLHALELKNPLIVGFGINSQETFREACRFTSGAIVGTAFVRALSEGRDIGEFVQSIRSSN